MERTILEFEGNRACGESDWLVFSVLTGGAAWAVLQSDKKSEQKEIRAKLSFRNVLFLGGVWFFIEVLS